ncbi:hypothetical protein LK09_04150 [Microbacterium mangrovi]|uniref:Alpha/beta hydrolase fold-5 domain-containing protein n=1 Tax=Microbacterium mangrovi TaxID=1348253 RepID=A0A0B2ABI9_9MICO|nr:hypothetical protein LK09_04150 [Microbacterium mangrovi]
MLVVAWVCLTEWGAVVHGHPAYAVWLGVTALASLWTAIVGLRGRPGRRRTTGRIMLVVLGAAWLGATAWLRPYTAVEPALTAMTSGSTVTVSETATRIVLTPRKNSDPTGVFFQPGALVDARAYAAVLRPLAADGHTVVIAKQPLGVAFLAVGALDAARTDFPHVAGWVVAGHSLGGTVAAMEADADDDAPQHPAVGLMLYASYPADDMSETLKVPVLSISGSHDGLSTPAKIAASRADLPSDALFVVVRGAVHAQFGSYGPQTGDGTPAISNADARRQISDTSVQWVDSVRR